MSTQRRDKVRRVGRPRASRRENREPVRDEILAAARTLFRSKGIAATTTREIAAAVGLRQPSLFHHFPSKQAIVRAVALGAVQPVLDFIEAEQPRRLPADVALYRLVRFDTLHLCTSEAALGIVPLLHEVNRRQVPELWEQRDRIIDAYRRLLRRGARSGALAVPELELTTRLLFALGESTLTWYQPGDAGHARRVAEVAADLALRAVLADGRRLDQVKAAAGQADAGPAGA